MPLELTAIFHPTGDQPRAIDQLTGWIRAGYPHATLLGVTGSGKSIAATETIFLAERKANGRLRLTVEPIGPWMDRVIDTHEVHARKKPTEGVTQVSGNGRWWTVAFHPKKGTVSLQPMSSLIRHRSPERLFRITTACGRSVTTTGDHNLWVLREGQLQLIRSDAVHRSDALPLPTSIPSPKHPLAAINLCDWLRDDRRIRVHARTYVVNRLRAGRRTALLTALRPYYRKPADTIAAMTGGQRGERIKLAAFRAWFPAAGYPTASEWRSMHLTAGKHRQTRAVVLANDAILTILGAYLAEGHAADRYTILSVREAAFRTQVTRAFNALNITWFCRMDTDFVIGSLVWTDFFRSTMGAVAQEKRLPPFWMDLNNRQLRVLLRAYFSGDGWVESNTIAALTASKRLASELLCALLRFGIWARVRKMWKRATNSAHTGAWYWQVSITGQGDLGRFLEHIGFSLSRKQQTGQALLGKTENSNVDTVPGIGTLISMLRRTHALDQQDIAAAVHVNRSTVSMWETHRRNPQRLTIRTLVVWCRRRGIRDDIVQQLAALSSVHWSPITSCEVVTATPYVYDVSVPGYETFLAGNGIFVHNTFTMAGVIAATQRPTLVISPNKTLAAQLYGEFKEFFPTAAVHYFVSYYDYYQPEAYVPQSDTYIEKEAQINEEIDRLRHAATQSLLTRSDVIIVASVSCIYGLGSPEEYGSVKMLIRVGDRIERRGLLRQLVDLQFQRNDIDLTRGTFRVKGDTVEIFPKASDRDWIRIAWNGDAIERITARDMSGATGSLEEVTIFPATHYVAAPAKFRTALDGIRSELEQQLRALRSQDKLLEAQRLNQRTIYDLQMLEETGYVHGIENYSRHFDGREPGKPPFTLVDFYNYAYGIGSSAVEQQGSRADRSAAALLPHGPAAASGWLCFIDESHVTIPQLRGMYAGDRSRKETLVSYGFRLPSCLDNRPLKFEEFRQRVPQTVYVSATPEEYELTMSTRSSSSRGAAATRDLTLSTSARGEISRPDRRVGARNDAVLVAEQLIRPTGLLDPEVEVRPSEGQIPNLILEIQERVRKHQRVLVTVLTKRMAEDLAEYLNERTLPTPSTSPSPREGEKNKKSFPPIRAFYLHADVETFERVEILDDLRRGRYDVVVGINLLREGLDLPEVSLVAILDADKEGYLRSRTALVQTMGRAARHAEGRVIMYADRMTESMRLAIAEVERRRKTQEAHNRAHGITPTSIVKEIRGPIVGTSKSTDQKNTIVQNWSSRRRKRRGGG